MTRKRGRAKIDQAVGDSVALIVALLTDDREGLQTVWRFHDDLFDIVSPLLMMVQVLGAFIDESDPNRTGETALEEIVHQFGALEPGKDDPGTHDAMRDGAALTLAWYRGDLDTFNQLLAIYREVNGEMLAGAVANIVIHMLSDFPEEERPDAARTAGEVVRDQLYRSIQE